MTDVRMFVCWSAGCWLSKNTAYSRAARAGTRRHGLTSPGRPAPILRRSRHSASSRRNHADRLVTAAEVFGQKGLGNGIESQPICRPGKPVSLVAEGHIG